MVGKEIEPSDIGKHQKLIKTAQAEMACLDVLVCGKCLGVFHFVEEFQSHKQNTCDKELAKKHAQESKPKVWAFLLWKSAQLHHKDDNGNNTNAWKLYQTWVKMDASAQETWIVAGKTIQSFTKFGQGSLQEMPVKITKTIIDNKGGASTPLAKTPITKPVAKKDDDVDSSSAIRSEALKQLRRPNAPLAPVSKLATSTPVVKSTNNRIAKRTVADSNELVDHNVEKIVAKRFNPRRRMHEYLVKWENIAHDSNTWEPHQNLENVPHILDIFEKQLARQKEQRAAQQAQQAAAVAAAAKLAELKKEKEKESQAAESKPDLSSTAGSDTWKKADDSMNSDVGSAKRKLEDSDFDDSSVMQEDFEDDLIPLHTVKRMKNGNTISVRVETKSDSKTVTTTTASTIQSPSAVLTTKITKVNGFTKTDSTGAEVVITKEVGSSGVVKKTTPTKQANSTQKTEAQIRVLSKGDNTSSGIVRIGATSIPTTNGLPSTTTTTAPASQPTPPTTLPTITSTTYSPHLVQKRPVQSQVVTKSAPLPTKPRQTPSNIGNVQITQVQTTRINPAQPGRPQQTPTANRYTQKTTTQTSTPVAQSRVLQSQPKTTIVQRTSLSPGNHQPATPASVAKTMIQQRAMKSTPVAKQSVTPEQKIIQLSKSGDLKVTKKTIPASGVQQKPVSRQRTEPSQIQIQKVQQIAPPNPSQVKRKTQEIMHQQQVYTMDEEDAAELSLCPKTGQILGRGGKVLELAQSQHSPIQSGVMQTQLVQQGQAIEVAQEMDEMQQTIDLANFDQQMMTNADGSPILVTGDDGTIYQVAGKNAEGQTILITQGADGEQQFAYVAADDGDAGMLSVDASMADVTQLLPEQAEALAAAGHGGETQFILKQEDGTTIVTDEAGNALQQPLSIKVNSDEDQDGNIPAEVVQADLPSPGGTRRVVLMLPDGTFMVTTMHDDEYQAINVTAS